MNRDPTTRQLQNGDELRCYLDEYRGRHSLHVRRWYRDDDGELRPGKGAAVPVAFLPWLRSRIEQLEADALKSGLLAEEDYELAGLPLPPALLDGAA